MSAQTITISCVQFSDTDYSVLKVAVNLLLKNKIPVKLLDKGDTSGKIFVVDIDTLDGRSFYAQFDYSGKAALLLLSNEMVNDQRNPVLRKPLRVQTLRDILHEMIVDQCPELAQQSSADDLATAKINGITATTDAQKTLLYALLQARREKQVMQVYSPPHPALYVEPIQGIIATSASRDMLRKITRSPAAVVIKTLSQKDFDILARGQQILPLTHVLWSAALYGSGGKLLEGHSLDTPVQLIAWPNFSRLEFEPEHMRLTSMMTARPISLREIHEKTKFPMEVICNFYNAVAAINLISIKPVTNKVVKAVAEPQKRSLFTKIATRLKIASWEIQHQAIESYSATQGREPQLRGCRLIATTAKRLTKCGFTVSGRIQRYGNEYSLIGKCCW